MRQQIKVTKCKETFIWAFFGAFFYTWMLFFDKLLKNCYQASSTVTITIYTLELRGSVCFNITTTYIIQNYKHMQI